MKKKFNDFETLLTCLDNICTMSLMLHGLKAVCEIEDDGKDLLPKGNSTLSNLEEISEWFKTRHRQVLLARGGKTIPVRFIGAKLTLVPKKK